MVSPSPIRAARTLSPGVYLAMLAAALLAILLLIPMPFKGRVASSVMDLFHAPAFALLAWIVCRAGAWRLPSKLGKKLLLVALPLAICGLAAEFVQSLVGRGASWHDARANLLGACAGVCWFQLQQHRQRHPRWPLWLTITLLFLLASAMPVLMIGDHWQQQRQFPLLASFESPLEASRFAAQAARIRRVAEFASDGQKALEIELLPGQFPGISLMDMPTDWTGYQALAFDLHVDAGTPLNLIVKVHDSAHRNHGYEGDDRFDGHFELAPGTHHIRIPLDAIRAAPRTRPMDMTDIDTWQLFTYDLWQPRTIVLDNLRLE